MYIESDSDKKYLEQLKRVNRFYKKVKSFSHGGMHQVDEECLDQIISFFLHCYHLKDWLEVSQPRLQDEIRELFSKDRGKKHFLMCRDLVVGIKHLSVSNPKLDSGNPTIAHQSVTVYAGTGMSRYSWDISYDGQKYDVYDLAKQCMEEWEEFLKKHNLPGLEEF
jgi:hypothetical protein